MTDWTGVSLVIAALGVALGTLIGAIASAYVSIMNEVRKNTAATYTSNGTPMGQLAEESETRRIARIPEDNRTPDEIEHIAVVPLPVRPGRDGNEDSVSL